MHFARARMRRARRRKPTSADYPQRPDRDGFHGRCILDRRPVNDPDRSTGPDPKGANTRACAAFAPPWPYRCCAEGKLIGVITATRETAGAFAEADVRLLRTFADQAAIAINNVSLFNENPGGAAATDRDRRRAEGHQPLGVRSASGVRYADASAVSLRRRRAGDLSSRRRCLRYRAVPTASPECRRFLAEHPSTAGRGVGGRRGRFRARWRCIRRRARRPANSRIARAHAGRHTPIVGVPLLRDEPGRRRARSDALEARPVHASARSSSCRPSPTRP